MFVNLKIPKIISCSRDGLQITINLDDDTSQVFTAPDSDTCDIWVTMLLNHIG